MLAVEYMEPATTGQVASESPLGGELGGGFDEIPRRFFGLISREWIPSSSTCILVMLNPSASPREQLMGVHLGGSLPPIADNERPN